MQNYTLLRTDSNHPAFQKLVIELDKELAIRDGEEHAFYDQFNKITNIKEVVVLFDKEAAIGCGAIKFYDATSMEVKRMYVPLAQRGQGIASIILKELEQWAKELGAQKCILETGIMQPEAIQLYQKNNYQRIANYGQYAGIENSVCFEKVIG